MKCKFDVISVQCNAVQDDRAELDSLTRDILWLLPSQLTRLNTRSVWIGVKWKHYSSNNVLDPPTRDTFRDYEPLLLAYTTTTMYPALLAKYVPPCEAVLRNIC